MREVLKDSQVTAREPSNELVVETRHADGQQAVHVVDARGYIARSVAIMGLVGVALIHLLDSGSKLHEQPYVVGLYVALMVGALIVAAALLHAEWRWAWIAAGALPALTMLGFILSRTVGLPGATGDIGNWGEPLGLASLFIEGCVVVLAIYRLALIRPAREV